MSQHPVLCIQLGAREHYAVPRALEAAGADVTLITDLWAANPGGSLLRAIGRGADRYHPGLGGKVISWNRSALVWELGARLARRQGWRLTEARNRWFRKKVGTFLNSQSGAEVRAVFAYSYCALEALQWARAQGLPGLLDQIDPGPALEKLICRLEGCVDCPSPNYWRNWAAETEAASTLVVNSEWSRRCLVGEGIAATRITVVPLAYEPAAARILRSYPGQFTAARQLRVLFLGRVFSLKGVAPLLDAMEQLATAGAPVVLDIVGGGDARLLARASGLPNCRIHGHCRRAEAERFYREADVFVLPTYSDGFALTQLEAQATGLPVIASRHCGDVVHNGVNGLLLEQVDAESIRSAIARLAQAPDLLTELAANSGIEARFSLESVGQAWGKLASGRISGRVDNTA